MLFKSRLEDQLYKESYMEDRHELELEERYQQHAKNNDWQAGY